MGQRLFWILNTIFSTELLENLVNMIFRRDDNCVVQVYIAKQYSPFAFICANGLSWIRNNFF
jgi:hypothetical protein